MAETNKSNLDGTEIGPERQSSDEEWSESVAERIAADNNIELSDAHWEAIRFVQDYYREHKSVHFARELAKALEARFEQQGGRKYLYRLFPKGPVRQTCNIGGVPVPEHTVDPSFGTSW